MLGEPQPTAFDLNFGVMGFRVRVQPWFWLAALILGMMGFSSPDAIRYYSNQEVQFPIVLYLLIFGATMFASILIHELGHAIAFRYYGISSHVVLYHFGGLAVPDGTYGYQGGQLDPRKQVIISAAGPAAQLLLAAIVLLLIEVAGHSPPVERTLLAFLPHSRDPIPNQLVYMFCYYLLYINIFWAVLNLVPVFPLDGGQIARGLFQMSDPAGGTRNSLWLSVVAGGGIAVFGFLSGWTFLAIMFAMLAGQSYMTLQQFGGGGGFGGGGYGGGRRPW